MRNRDDHHHDHQPARPQEPDLESALVQRLQKMEWPKPPPGVRDRCLTRLLGYMESIDGDEAADPAVPQAQRRFAPEQTARPAHGAEQRNPATRRSIAGYRSPVRFADRPVRLAAAL
jgi:hypothetical protein